jgi:hypothetical protein
MTSVPIRDVVADIQSGDWGSPEGGGELREFTVLRATDFARAASGDLSMAPRRFLRPRSLERRRLQQDDLLVEMSGGSADQPTGRLLRVPHMRGASVSFSNFLKRLRLMPCVDPGYFSMYWLYLYSRGATRPYEKRTTGIRNFDLSNFLDTESIPLPALDQQRRVGRILTAIRRASTTAQIAVDTKRQAFETFREEVFRAHPPTTRLAKLVTDIRYGSSEKCTDSGIGPAVLGIKNVGDVVLDARKAGRLPRVPGPGDRGWLEPGDLLFVRTNADPNRIGRCAVFEGTPKETMFASYLLRARLGDSEMDPRFIAHFAASRAGRSTLRAGGSGAADGKFNLNAPTLGNWVVPRPPLSLQASILTQLDRWMESLDADTRLARSTDLVFASALQVLMESSA